MIPKSDSDHRSSCSCCSHDFNKFPFFYPMSAITIDELKKIRKKLDKSDEDVCPRQDAFLQCLCCYLVCTLHHKHATLEFG